MATLTPAIGDAYIEEVTNLKCESSLTKHQLPSMWNKLVEVARNRCFAFLLDDSENVPDIQQLGTIQCDILKTMTRTTIIAIIHIVDHHGSESLQRNIGPLASYMENNLMELIQNCINCSNCITSELEKNQIPDGTTSKDDSALKHLFKQRRSIEFRLMQGKGAYISFHECQPAILGLRKAAVEMKVAVAIVQAELFFETLETYYGPFLLEKLSKLVLFSIENLDDYDVLREIRTEIKSLIITLKTDPKRNRSTKRKQPSSRRVVRYKVRRTFKYECTNCDCKACGKNNSHDTSQCKHDTEFMHLNVKQETHEQLGSELFSRR